MAPRRLLQPQAGAREHGQRHAQRGQRAGLWIEGGELAFPVEEITIAGNLLDMLRDVDAVGSELLWLGRVASPPLRVARMTVAGEA